MRTNTRRISRSPRCGLLRELLIGLFLLFVSLGLINCSSTPCPQKSARVDEPLSAKAPTAFVFRYDGTLQCGMGRRILIEDMQKDLKGIEVLSSSHMNDGLMRIQLCGSPTGDANIYEINEKDLEQAKTLGFREWTFGRPR